MLEKKTFAMSMFASKTDLYKAKAAHYEGESEKLQMEVVVLEAKLAMVGDIIDNLNNAMDMPTGAEMVIKAFDAEIKETINSNS